MAVLCHLAHGVQIECFVVLDRVRCFNGRMVNRATFSLETEPDKRNHQVLCVMLKHTIPHLRHATKAISVSSTVAPMVYYKHNEQNYSTTAIPPW